MKQLTKEDGITLIEVLATITILSIVIVIASRVFFSGFDYSEKANETISLQQEANLIVTNINKFHESGYDYTFELDHNPSASIVKIVGKNQSGTNKTVEFSNKDYEYSLYDYSGNMETSFNTIRQVKTTEPLYIKIVIKNKKHPGQIYDVKTIINRL
jgi:prepilin-type N-terminal cleavage/methylation domain-containing protein